MSREPDALARLGVRPPFCVYPANHWPHKNHLRLLEAMAALRNLGAKDLQLVLTGADFGSETATRQACRDLEQAGAVVCLGYTSRADVLTLCRHALFVVFPSLYEGFGLPIVEAMTLGCPVAASRMASIPEVAGEAALYFDAEDARSIAEAMIRMLRDEGLRQALIAKGRERARLFTAERCARETLSVLDRAVAFYRAHPVPGWRAASIGRHRYIYDGASLAFRCPEAERAEMVIARPPGDAGRAWLTILCEGRTVGGGYLPEPGRDAAFVFECRADASGLARVCFRLARAGGPLGWLKGRLWAPGARVERLLLHRSGGDSLCLVGSESSAN